MRVKPSLHIGKTRSIAMTQQFDLHAEKTFAPTTGCQVQVLELPNYNGTQWHIVHAQRGGKRRTPLCTVTNSRQRLRTAGKVRGLSMKTNATTKKSDSKHRYKCKQNH